MEMKDIVTRTTTITLEPLLTVLLIQVDFHVI